MKTLGECLKAARKNAGYSQKKVYEKTGITDSRLSRIERDTTFCPPSELRKLSDLYQMPVIDIFIKAGYLTETDLAGYQGVFHGVSKLDTEERNHIQQGIDLLTKGRDQT